MHPVRSFDATVAKRPARGARLQVPLRRDDDHDVRRPARWAGARLCGARPARRQRDEAWDRPRGTPRRRVAGRGCRRCAVRPPATQHRPRRCVAPPRVRSGRNRGLRACGRRLDLADRCLASPLRDRRRPGHARGDGPDPADREPRPAARGECAARDGTKRTARDRPLDRGRHHRRRHAGNRPRRRCGQLLRLRCAAGPDSGRARSSARPPRRSSTTCAKGGPSSGCGPGSGRR